MMKINNTKTSVSVLLLAAACLLPSYATVPSGQRMASEVDDTIKTDTLREVTVEADTTVKIPISNSTKAAAGQKDNSLGGIIQRKAAKANDIITHPFGFKERKKKAKRKKVQKVLQQYDAIQDPVQHFLDSLEQAHKK